MCEDTGMESVIEVENWIQCQVDKNESKKKKNERDACLVIQSVVSEERKNTNWERKTLSGIVWKEDLLCQGCVGFQVVWWTPFSPAVLQRQGNTP